MSEWFEEAFTAIYLEYYSHRTGLEALEDVAFAQEVLGIKKDHVVLDLCSGSGRHSRNLANICKLVVSYDLSFDLLQTALQEQRKNQIENIWSLMGDVRNLSFYENFDFVVSFFNSVGYFDEASNEKNLKNIYRAMHAKGKLLLDIMNPNYLRETLKTSTSKETENYIFHENRSIIESKNRVEKEVKIYDRHNNVFLKEYKESVRFYEKEEIYALLESCGFKVLDSFGDNKNSPFELLSPRHIITICK